MSDELLYSGHVLIGLLGVAIVVATIILHHRYSIDLGEGLSFWLPIFIGVLILIFGFFGGQVALIALLLFLLIITPCNPPTY